jgi:hypothetical protein
MVVVVVLYVSAAGRRAASTRDGGRDWQVRDENEEQASGLTSKHATMLRTWDKAIA